jgi:NAD(P)-dependent dehydrogenase (short-subunit alcohol dehydrogenase family)
LGRINVLINNAGIFIPKAFTDYTTEDFNALVSHDAGGLSLRITAVSEANVATEER